jgi:DNA helicase-2/ATP-dependent DNA helicase PcrA
MTKFNEQQLQAINFHKGACGVVASAGAGKTSVLLNRIKNLVDVHKEKQSDILAISFTSKTSIELKTKLEAMGLDRVNTGTFHAICLRIMIKEGLDVRGKLVQQWKAENWFKEVDKKPFMEDILGFIGYQKSYMRGVDDEFASKDSNYTEEELRVFYRLYEHNKKLEGLYDFDDYLLICLDILQRNKGKYTFEFVLVDEHQDSNLIQNMILKEICQSGNIFAVGDPRQSIYSFRAGNLEYFMNFHKYWKNPTIINLFINYRSTNNIVGYSNNFIRPYFNNYEHYVDTQANNKSDGVITCDTYTDDAEEALAIAEKIQAMTNGGTRLNTDIAILYRLNSQSAYIENELKRRSIEYDVSNDGSFFKRREVAGIASYLRLIANPHDESAMESIFRFRCHPLKFFSNKTIEEIRVHSGKYNMSMYEAMIDMNYKKAWEQKSAMEFENIITRLRLQLDKGVTIPTLIGNIYKTFKIEEFIREKYNSEDEIKDRIKSVTTLKSFATGNNIDEFITYIYSANQKKKKAKKGAIKLMSIHASKGLEFEDVFVIGVEDEVLPHEKCDLAEEARLFYVAVTRSISNLFLSQIGTDNKFIKDYFKKH